MKVVLEDAIEVANGIWLTFAPPHRLTMFGRPATTIGHRSVVLAASPTFNREASSLVVDADNLTVLSVGTTPSTVVIDTIVSAEALHQHGGEDHEMGPGDREFLLLAEAELDGEAQETAVDLLREIRRIWPGDLKRGERNNFSNTPDNFWYVIVQPRVNALSITIRGSPERFSSTALDLKPDRPGYTRFSLRKPEEITEAMRLIGDSKRKGIRRI